MTDFSMILFARPSFTEGAARLFDFGNTLSEYNISESADLADFRAVQADGRAVAADLKHGLEADPREQKQKIAKK